MPHSHSSALLRVRHQPSLVPLPVSAPVARLRVSAPAVLLLVVLRAYLRAISQVLHLISRVSTVLPEHGLDRGGPANFRGVEGRIAASSANSYTRNGYASHGYGRGYRYWPHAAAATAAAAYAYGGSYASSEEDCYYVSAYRRDGTYGRVLRCGGN
jgi:hypothetical protein